MKSAAVHKGLSNNPEAIRKRKARADKKLRKAPLLGGRYAPADRVPHLSDREMDELASLRVPPAVAPTVFETVPVVGPGADAFVLQEQPADASSSEPAPEQPPLVEPAPEPAPAVDPLAAEKAAAKAKADKQRAQVIASLMAQFFGAGLVGIFETSEPFREYVSGLAGSPEEALAYLPKAVEFVEANALACVERYNFRIPYMEEGVVILALGIGGYGIARKRKMLAQLAEAQAARAKSENAQPADIVQEPADRFRPSPPPKREDAGQAAA